MPLYEHRVQCPVKILTRADTRGLNGCKRVEHRARPDRNARRAQRAGKIEDVFGKPAGVLSHSASYRSSPRWREPNSDSRFGGNERIDYSAARKSDFISSSSSLTLLPSSRAMSS